MFPWPDPNPNYKAFDVPMHVPKHPCQIAVEAYIGVRVRAKSPWKPTGGGTSGNARQTEARVDEPRFKRVLNVNMYDEPA